jgi:TonB family protein
MSITAQNIARSDERRAKTRAPVNPPIYVDIEGVNGGLAYNMTEDGIAMSAAKVLCGHDRIGMRIQLPGAGGWIEAIGKIKWKSGSGKTAGVSFVGLAEEARKRIREWLTAQRSKAELQPEVELGLKSPQHFSGHTQARDPVLSLPTPLTPLSFAKATAPQQGLRDESYVSADRLAGTAAARPPKSIQVDAHSPANGGASAQLCERREHPRHEIAPVSYVEVGPDNRGMLLNISESGLAFIVAMRLAQDDFTSMRIQFADSMESIEVCGQIAWLSDSKREAGLRFVNLTEEARKKIASRIPQEQLPLQARENTLALPAPCLFQPEIPELPKLKILTPEDALSDVGLCEQPQMPAASPFALQSAPQVGTSPNTDAWDVASQNFSLQPQLHSGLKPEISSIASRSRIKRSRGLAAALTLAAVITLTISRIATLPPVQNEMGGYVARSTPNTTKLNPEINPENRALSTSKAADSHLQMPENSDSRPRESQPRAATADRAHGPETHAAATLPGKRSVEHRPSNPPVTYAIRQAQGALPENQPARLSENALSSQPKPVENSPNQVVANAPQRPQKESAPATAANLPTDVPSGTTVAAMKQVESPTTPSVQQPLAPATPTWSVAVSTDPYPSIRVSGNTNSQKPSPGKNLWIGHAISRIEPVYPEDAKRQGIEGAVKLHVIVSRDGQVRKVELASGPALLAQAAMRAIREWRYSLTLVGGQSVETEQDVVVTFRLVSR